MNTTPTQPTQPPEATTDTVKQPAQDSQLPACEKQVPNGFEEFDLEDIEVIESKVFA
jgi:hypothetical protein